MAACHSFLSQGTFVLANVKGGTALDLAGGGTRMEGHIIHYHDNQQWKFINAGQGWSIQSGRKSKDGKLLYLSIAGGRLAEHTPVTPSTVPTGWEISLINGALRIAWPKTDYVVELGNWGDPKPGTRVQIMRLKKDEPCQLWHFTRCGKPAELEPGNAAKEPAEPKAAKEDAAPAGLAAPLPPATHILAHTQGDIALELDNASRKWVKHRALHKAPSQQWHFIAAGEETAVQACRASLDGEPLYLTVQGRAERGARVVASPYPVGWHVERAQAKDRKCTIRMFWPQTNLVISAQKFFDSDNVRLEECDDSPSSEWSDLAA